MKKFFSVAILAAVLIFVGGQEKVFAYDVFCGTYRDGNRAYLMTETISGYNEDFTLRVKAVRNRSVMYISYRFYVIGGPWVCFENSQGFKGFVTVGRGETISPVAREIFVNACNVRNWDRYGA